MGQPPANHAQPAGIYPQTGWLDALSLPVLFYGQPDTQQFPLAFWRAAANWLHGGVRDPSWVIDHIDQDVPMLVEQIRTRVLPKRGIVAAPDENPHHAGVTKRPLFVDPPVDVPADACGGRKSGIS